MTHDDRGQRVSLLRTSVAATFRPIGSSARAQLLRRIDRRVQDLLPGRMGAVAAVAMPVFVFAGLGAALVSRQLLVIALAAILAATLSHLTTLIAVPVFRDCGAQLIRACLEAQVCPACRYPLGDLRADADGCRVCPECGAAWRTATGDALIPTRPTGAGRSALATIAVDDHRGRRVRMLTLPGARLIVRRDRSLPSDLWGRIEDRAGWTTRLSGVQQLGCAAVCAAGGIAVLAVAAAMAPIVRSIPGMILLQTILAACFCLGIWAVFARFNQRRHAPEAIAGFLAERRCPCCVYDVSGCACDDDGCTVCPECGAAWRVPEAARAGPP